jgi:glutathione S-transferase
MIAMLQIHVIQPAFGLRAASNFSVKAMALLNMAGLPYETFVMTPNKGPRGKLPVLVDNGKVIPDSTHIQSHLENAHGARFDDGLSPRDLADAEAYRKLGEEHLYWAILHVRYFEYPDLTRNAIFDALPKPVRGVVFGMIRRMVRRSLHGHGLGRHTAEEIHALGVRDVNAIAARIGDGPFFFGAMPHSIDAALYPLLESIAVPDMPGPLRNSVINSPTLMNYIKRCDAYFFSKS